MNLPLQPTPPIPWHLLLETLADGKITAWVAELPDCRIVADTREAAIAALEPLIEQRTAAIEAISFQPNLFAAEHPSFQFIGIFEGNTAFMDILAVLRAERELTNDNPAYT
jgi:predicted RNase H-like HicB family nuclease